MSVRLGTIRDSHSGETVTVRGQERDRENCPQGQCLRDGQKGGAATFSALS